MPSDSDNVGLVSPGSDVDSPPSSDTPNDAGTPGGKGWKSWSKNKKLAVVGGGGLVIGAIVYLYIKHKQGAAASTTPNNSTTPTLVLPNSTQGAGTGSFPPLSSLLGPPSPGGGAATTPSPTATPSGTPTPVSSTPTPVTSNPTAPAPTVTSPPTAPVAPMSAVDAAMAADTTIAPNNATTNPYNQPIVTQPGDITGYYANPNNFVQTSSQALTGPTATALASAEAAAGNYFNGVSYVPIGTTNNYVAAPTSYTGTQVLPSYPLGGAPVAGYQNTAGRART